MSVVFTDPLPGDPAFEDVFQAVHKLFATEGIQFPPILDIDAEQMPVGNYCESLAINHSWVTMHPVSYDHRGRKVEEEEEDFAASDERQQELFDTVKAMFSPSLYPSLQSIWSKVWEVQISLKEIRFHVMPDTPVDKPWE
jgi:hypothetical protein